MATIPKQMYRGTLGITNTTLYTVPTGVTAIVKNIVITNATANNITALIDSVGTRIVSNTTIVGNDTVVIDLTLVLNAGQSLRGYASVGSAADVHISGVEVS